MFGPRYVPLHLPPSHSTYLHKLTPQQKGDLYLAKERPYNARSSFESALTHFPNHPPAIVGLSNILMDIYTEKLLPPPAIPKLDDSHSDDEPLPSLNKQDSKFPALPSVPLGLAKTSDATAKRIGNLPSRPRINGSGSISPPTSPVSGETPLPAAHEATSLPLNDRLAARDRAYGLLSGLTKLGEGWNYSEAWFALARAYEESGQVEKAKDALWWCVELEDGMGVREWRCLGGGGYVL